jgi:hypothetical protein
LIKKKTLNSFLTSSDEESQGLAEKACFIFTFCGGNLANKSTEKEFIKGQPLPALPRNNTLKQFAGHIS